MIINIIEILSLTKLNLKKKTRGILINIMRQKNFPEMFFFSKIKFNKNMFTCDKINFSYSFTPSRYHAFDIDEMKFKHEAYQMKISMLSL